MSNETPATSIATPQQFSGLKAGQKVLALSGGVGGAKLALGLSKLLKPDQLSVVCNTADDFEHLGLPISPDLDTVMYTLAQINNQQQGWGLADETWSFMAALKNLKGESWFMLGDRDLATHVERRRLLDEGCSLTQVTTHLACALGVQHPIIPMTDETVSTVVHSDQGDLSFQHYFVREQCAPKVTGFTFEGMEQAKPSEQFLALLNDPDLAAIIICPSNPFVSVDPILSLPGVRELMKRSPAPVIAVSPIVGGEAIKGPAAKMLKELKLESSAEAVVAFYGDLLDGFVIDEVDQSMSESIANTMQDKGIDPGGLSVAQTVMRTLDDRIDLARHVLTAYISTALASAEA
jgi:LPPG:FO 2-phospho-L-lactate transferase